MANLEYEGAVDNINDYQLKFIGDVLEKRGYKDTKVEIEVLGAVGDNYIASVKRFTVIDSDGKPFKMIAKIAPQHEHMRFAAKTHELFVNEKIMYTEVLPKFRELQRAAEVPDCDILRFAECYGCLTDAPNEVILLEDLKESNFIMLDRFKSLTDECVKSVLKNIAILHSLSFALKYKEPQLFQDYASRLFDLWSNTLPETAAYFGLLEKNALTLMSDNEDRIAILKRVALIQLGDIASKLSKTDSGTKHTVIQQGDSWTNNIMFKFDDDALQESIMIDYQISKENSPVADVLYLILNCTDHQLRLKHYQEWIDYYHKELDRALANYGLKAAYVYPQDQLDVDLKRYGKLMFSLSIVLASVMTMKSEDAAKLKDLMEQGGTIDMNKIPVKIDETENIMLFKSKVEGLIDTCAEFGLL